MIKLIYSLFLFMIFNTLECSSKSSTYELCTYDCGNVNNVNVNYPTPEAIKHLNDNKWWVVKYTDGRYYYHNFETNVDTWDYPFHDIGYETITLSD